MFSNLCWRPFYATNSRRVTATLTTNEEHGLCPTSGLITARPGLLQKIIGTLSRDEASGQRAKLFDYAEAEAARCRHNHATEGSEGHRREGTEVSRAFEKPALDLLLWTTNGRERFGTNCISWNVPRTTTDLMPKTLT
jgi:hypothetical protein